MCLELQVTNTTLWVGFGLWILIFELGCHVAKADFDPLSFITPFSLGPNFTDWLDWLASELQESTCLLLPYFPRTMSIVLFGCYGLELSSCACTASSFPTEPSPKPSEKFSKCSHIETPHSIPNSNHNTLRQRQEDHHKLKASLDYIVRPCLEGNFVI